jgi:hypothetical protein
MRGAKRGSGTSVSSKSSSALTSSGGGDLRARAALGFHDFAKNLVLRDAADFIGCGGLHRGRNPNRTAGFLEWIGSGSKSCVAWTSLELGDDPDKRAPLVSGTGERKRAALLERAGPRSWACCG